MKAAVVDEYGAPLRIEEVLDTGAWSRRGAREDRDLRPVPHGHPRRSR